MGYLDLFLPQKLLYCKYRLETSYTIFIHQMQCKSTLWHIIRFYCYLPTFPPNPHQAILNFQGQEEAGFELLLSLYISPLGYGKKLHLYFPPYIRFCLKWNKVNILKSPQFVSVWQQLADPLFPLCQWLSAYGRHHSILVRVGHITHLQFSAFLSTRPSPLQ